MKPDEHKSHARTMFAKHPGLFPEDRRQSILDGVVILGMTPFEAHLAAGAFIYKVVADKNIWSDQKNPLKVIWAQSTHADNSEIWMIFNNSSQFSDTRDIEFRVYFERGCATKIEKLEEVC